MAKLEINVPFETDQPVIVVEVDPAKPLARGRHLFHGGGVVREFAVTPFPLRRQRPQVFARDGRHQDEANLRLPVVFPAAMGVDKAFERGAKRREACGAGKRFAQPEARDDDIGSVFDEHGLFSREIRRPVAGGQHVATPTQIADRHAWLQSELQKERLEIPMHPQLIRKGVSHDRNAITGPDGGRGGGNGHELREGERERNDE